MEPEGLSLKQTHNRNIQEKETNRTCMLELGMGGQEVADSTWEFQHWKPGVGTLDCILAGGAKGCSSAEHKVLFPANGDTYTNYNTNTSSFIYQVFVKLLLKMKSNKHG